MRITKYRSWNKEHDSFFYFLNGKYYNSEDCNHCISERICFEFQWSNAEQYTGLKDKNGKEIYEGDIVHHERSVEGTDQDGSYDINLTREGNITITVRGVMLNGWFKTEYEDGRKTETNKHYNDYVSRMSDYGEIISNIHESK